MRWWLYVLQMRWRLHKYESVWWGGVTRVHCARLSCKMLLLGDKTSGSGKLLGTGGGMVRTRRWYRLPEIPNKRAHTHTRHAEYSYTQTHTCTPQHSMTDHHLWLLQHVLHILTMGSVSASLEKAYGRIHTNTHLNIQWLYVICDCCDKMCTYP